MMQKSAVSTSAPAAGGGLFDSLAGNAAGIAVNLAAVAAIVIIGFWLSGFARRSVARIGKANPKLDATLFNFLGSLAGYAVLAVTILMALDRFGVETTSIVAIIGAAGLAIGLALQSTLSNLAAGVMLMLFRPFSVGDVIDGGGVSGKVTSIGLFTTELTTPDAQHVIAPNSSLWGSKLVNHSHYPVRGVDLRFKIDGATPIDAAREALARGCAATPKALADPAPFIAVENAGDGNLEFLVRLHCKAEHLADVRYSAPEAIKRALDAAKIAAPVPHQVVVSKPDR